MLHPLETEAVDGILSMVFCGIITVNKIPQAQPLLVPSKQLNLASVDQELLQC